MSRREVNLSTSVIAAWRLLLILALSVILYIQLQLRLLIASDEAAQHHIRAQAIRRWCRGIATVLRLRIKVVGTLPAGPALLAPNHIGYGDIIAIGAATQCQFLTRTEYLKLPFLGSLFRAVGLIHAGREIGRQMSEVSDQMRAVYQSGQSLCVFLEGTSTGGDRVLPFGPAFIQPALDSDASIIPVALRWRAKDPTVSIPEDIAFWKDHEIGPHLWGFLGLNGISVRIEFCPPLPRELGDRKVAAQLARESVCSASKLPPDSDLGWKPTEAD